MVSSPSIGMVHTLAGAIVVNWVPVASGWASALAQTQRALRLVYIAGSAFVAVSVAFPPFLIARELRAGTSDGPPLRKIDTIGLALLGCAITALSIWVDVK